ncbi:hypothetical protein EKK58_06595 [Candidatus Dependentiae bacterium]|nr:MAG: hypothetical protein EKK58_06595 [Candidatus Dependentiae bacterium]
MVIGLQKMKIPFFMVIICIIQSLRVVATEPLLMEQFRYSRIKNKTFSSDTDLVSENNNPKNYIDIYFTPLNNDIFACCGDIQWVKKNNNGINDIMEKTFDENTGESNKLKKVECTETLSTLSSICYVINHRQMSCSFFKNCMIAVDKGNDFVLPCLKSNDLLKNIFSYLSLVDVVNVFSITKINSAFFRRALLMPEEMNCNQDAIIDIIQQMCSSKQYTQSCYILSVSIFKFQCSITKSHWAIKLFINSNNDCPFVLENGYVKYRSNQPCNENEYEQLVKACFPQRLAHLALFYFKALQNVKKLKNTSDITNEIEREDFENSMCFEVFFQCVLSLSLSQKQSVALLLCKLLKRDIEIGLIDLDEGFLITKEYINKIKEDQLSAERQEERIRNLQCTLEESNKKFALELQDQLKKLEEAKVLYEQRVQQLTKEYGDQCSRFIDDNNRQIQKIEELNKENKIHKEHNERLLKKIDEQEKLIKIGACAVGTFLLVWLVLNNNMFKSLLFYHF